jgi:hypothetical protein
MVNTGWCAKTYYEYAEIISSHDNLHSNMFGGVEDADSQKWTKVCGSCHVMLKDHGNSEVEFVRKYNLGMSADYVKNGNFIEFTSDKTARGYDVHMSEGTIGCGSCHLIQQNYHGTNDPNTDVEAMHNFLKGTDTAHNVRNDLDNNIRPKNCEQCHIEQIEAPGNAANPTAAHEARFGENTAIHMEKISCQTCHKPYTKTWRFRAFDDTLGYYGNFDNRMGYDVLGKQQNHSDQTMNIMGYPAEYAISGVYAASPGYGIPHFNMVAQAIDANDAGTQVPMDWIAQMVNYFHMTKSGTPGQMVNGMPTNPNFDFWKYFYQMFWGMNRQGLTDNDGSTIMSAAWPDRDISDNLTYPPLYYGNGTNGYPQIVAGNPITIMTWADAGAGDADGNGLNEMSNLYPGRSLGTEESTSVGGAKILFLREIMSAISEYYPPTNLMATMDLNPDPTSVNYPTEGTNNSGSNPSLFTWANVPSDGVGDAFWQAYPGLGKVILKDAGYIIWDHTGDMYPELWSTLDVQTMQALLNSALNAEDGDNNANAIIFIAAHYFSDSHSIKPANEALGANSCFDCHGDATQPGQAGGHRITDRILGFLPWLPEWYTQANQIAGGLGGSLFLVDHEVDYLNPHPHDAGGSGIQAGINGRFSFVGATQENVLEHTRALADHFFYQNHGEEVLGGAIYGVNWNRMTNEEKHRTYVPQVTNPRGNQSLKTRDWIPATIREDVTAFGYAPVTQKIKIALNDGSHQEAMAKVFIYGLHIDPDGPGPEHGAPLDEAMDGIIVKLSQASTSNYVGAMYKPLVVFQQAGAEFDDEWIEISDNNLSDEQRRAQVVRFGDNNDNRYILRAGPGRYAAVHVLDMEAATAVVDCDLGTAGIQIEDECGTCDDDPYNDCQLGCDDVWGSGLIEDECGNCGAYVYGTSRDVTCLEDCSGVYGGGATTDDCGVCDTMPGNDNTTCDQDCAGTWDGDFVIDLHQAGNPCVAPATVFVQDCDGTWVTPGTTQTFDECGVCGGVTTTCTADCIGEYPYIAGTAETGPLGNTVVTHARRNPLYDSSRTFDDCGVCLSPLVTEGCAAEEAAYRTCTVGCDPVNDAYQECLNTHDKTKNTLYNQSCDRDCAGKWDGGAQVDSCGVCIDTDNPLDIRVPHATCSADCDTELAYTDGAKLTTDTTFDAWTWVGDYNNPNYGYGSKNVNTAYDSAKELDACGVCDTNSVNDCIQEEEGLMWQAGNAATIASIAGASPYNITGLQPDDIYTQDPDEAAAFCAQLTFGTTSAGDWRLPTNAELMSLVGTSLQYFVDAPYWTSEAYSATVTRSVDFATGTPGVNYNTEALHVRCVLQ